MGCDIHDYVEVYDTESKSWRPFPEMIENPYPEDDPTGRVLVPVNFHITGGRDYNAFAIMAGVRDRGDFVPIQERYLLPPDVSSEVKAEHESWGQDAHSAGWITAREFLMYNWGQATTLSGITDLHTFARWADYARKNGDDPRYYSQSVHGPNIKIISMKDAEDLLKCLVDIDPKQFANWYREGTTIWGDATKKHYSEIGGIHVKCVWDQLYSQAAGHLYQVGVPRLINIARQRHPDWNIDDALEAVRSIFWFDN